MRQCQGHNKWVKLFQNPTLDNKGMVRTPS